MTNQQAPEALRLAASLELFWGDIRLYEAAAELRRLHCENERLAALVEAQQPAPSAAVGNSGFDHKTAADFLNGKTVSDEAMRKFVSASRWAHDDRAALRATLLSVRGELASREAEIALLKKALIDAEAPQPSPTPQADSQPAPVLDREAVIRAAVAAMPHTNPMVADDLLGGFTMHTEADDVIAIFEAGRAARAPADSVTAPAGEAGLMVDRATVIEWLDANDIEVTDRQMEGLFHFAAPTPPTTSAGSKGEL